MEKENDIKQNITYQPTKLFKKSYLSTFSLDNTRLSLDEKTLEGADKSLLDYQKSEIDWQLEEDLHRRNQMLTSFAISKAENSGLTIKEAEEIYEHIKSGKGGKDLYFLEQKIKAGKKLTQKDHDKLEYLNISNTFNYYSDKGISIESLNLDLILDIHNRITYGLDIFDAQISDFETYRSGKFRNNDKTRVERYVPAPSSEIKESIEELLKWLKSNPSVYNIFIFHVALYAIHPFKNGNKRVCRLLEHFLLKDLKFNIKDLYSTSNYYHKEKDRYYKYLLESLYKRDFSYFASFAAEGLFFSVCEVITGVLQRKKTIMLKQSNLDDNIIKILKPLTKRKQANFSKLFKINKKKVSRQTFSNYLSLAVENGILKNERIARNSFYALSGDWIEENLLSEKLKIAKDKIGFIPNNLVTYL